MTQPTRLLDGDLDDFERALLRSATNDRGSERARVRALAVWGALGLELAASGAAAGTASTGLISGAAMPPAKGAVSAVTASLLAKWLGMGALVGTLTAGGAFAVQGGTFVKSASSPTTAQNPSVAPGHAEKRTAEGSAAVPGADPQEGETKVASSLARSASEGATNPEPSPVVAEAREGVSSVAFPVDSAGALSEELAHLERARRALRAADVTGALRELSRYSARFPKGALLEEATLLTVEARLDAGDLSGARAAAARILDGDRTSPHARRLQSLFARKEKR
jgi:hypothetical protein